MSDTTCIACGEPWDLHHLRHDVGTDEEADDAGYIFHVSATTGQICRSIVLRCPCCPRDEGILRAMIEKGSK